jgi:hypothetical protein
MRYAKLIDGFPIYAPNPILHNGSRIGNPTPEVYLAEGYKPVIFYDEPEPLGVGRWEEVWTEDAQNIYRSWEWHEATDTDEISNEEVLQILLGGNIE